MPKKKAAPPAPPAPAPAPAAAAHSHEDDKIEHVVEEEEAESQATPSAVDLDEVLREAKAGSLSTRIKDATTDFTESTKGFVARFKYVLIGVVALIVLAVGGVQLWGAFYPQYLKGQAESFYENQQYAEAIEAANSYREYNATDTEVIYLSALANIKLLNFSDAIRDLQRLAGTQDLARADVDFYFYQAMTIYPTMTRVLDYLARALEAEPDHVPSKLLRAVYAHSTESSVSESDKVSYIVEINNINTASLEQYADQIGVLLAYLMSRAEDIFPEVVASFDHNFGLEELPGVRAGFRASFNINPSGLLQGDVEYDAVDAVNIMRLAVLLLDGQRKDPDEEGYAQVLLDKHASRKDLHLAAFVAAVHKANEGDFEAAQRLFAEVGLSFPTDPHLLINKATAEMLTNNDAHLVAIEDYNRAIVVDTDNLVALNNRGFTGMWFTENLNKAKLDFSEVLRLAPDDLVGSYNMAHAHYLSEEYTDAVALFNRVAEANPIFGNVYLYRGRTNRHLRKFELAVKDFNDFKIQDPDSVEPYIQNALMYDRSAGYKLAIQELQTAHTLHPGDKRVGTLLADYYLRSDQALLADRLIDDLLSEDPGDIRVRLLNGRLLLAQGNPDAEEVLQSVYDQRSEDPEAVEEQTEAAIYYIDALMLNERYDEVLRLTRNLLPKSPDNIELLKRRALAFSNNDQKTEAEQFALRARELDPTDFDVQVVLGDIYSDSGRFSEAIQTYQIAYKIRPTDIDLLFKLESIYDLLNQGENLRQIREQIARVESQQLLIQQSQNVLQDIASSTSAVPEEVAAQNVAQIEKMKETVAQFDQRIANNPSDPVLYHNRGVIHLALGNIEEAISSMQEAVAIEPENPEFRMVLAEAFIRRGEYDNAVDELSVIIEENPDNFEAIFNRAVANHNAKNLEEAVADYTSAIRLNPGYVNAYYNRGAIFVELSDYGRAIEELTRVIELRSDYINAYLARAQVYRLTGDLEKAENDMQAAELLRASFKESGN